MLRAAPDFLILFLMLPDVKPFCLNDFDDLVKLVEKRDEIIKKRTLNTVSAFSKASVFKKPLQKAGWWEQLCVVDREGNTV